jgi:hypothetical protein
MTQAKKDREPHVPKLAKKLGNHVCIKCGLVYLRNRATEVAANASCPDNR